MPQHFFTRTDSQDNLFYEGYKRQLEAIFRDFEVFFNDGKSMEVVMCFTRLILMELKYLRCSQDLTTPIRLQQGFQMFVWEHYFRGIPPRCCTVRALYMLTRHMELHHCFIRCEASDICCFAGGTVSVAAFGFGFPGPCTTPSRMSTSRRSWHRTHMPQKNTCRQSVQQFPSTP